MIDHCDFIFLSKLTFDLPGKIRVSVILFVVKLNILLKLGIHLLSTYFNKNFTKISVTSSSNRWPEEINVLFIVKNIISRSG